MDTIAVGNWIKGPFANATIEGFILEETPKTFIVTVTKIEIEEGHPPTSLYIGSVHDLPKLVIQEFYAILDEQQQCNLIQLASALKQDEWVNELMEKFGSPTTSLFCHDCEYYETCVYSDVLKQLIHLKVEDKTQLYEMYKSALPEGVRQRIQCPEDIKTKEDFDSIITYIILSQNTAKGLELIKKLY